jgi:TetR/AcrR family transcriptional regulator
VLTFALTILLNKKVKYPVNKEELIKQAAKELFFSKGYLHATTQEIADAAGVNRALINYYFRSRDLLFQTVYREAVDSLKTKLNDAIARSIPFKEKLELFIDVYMEELIRYPYRESFLITEICSKNFAIQEKKKSSMLSIFIAEIATEMDNGTIKKSNPIHFILDIFSAVAYPIIMKPLYAKLLDVPQADYEQLLSERKQIILQNIFN